VPVFKSPGGPVKERISEGARDLIVSQIDASGGNEVFFVGHLDGEGLVTEVRALARGNDESVPAPVAEAQAGDVVIHNHPAGILVPSGADIEVASYLGGQSVGFYIIDNDCRRVYAVVEPRQTREPPERLDPAMVSNFFGLDGPLSAAHPNYEERLDQGRMAADVAGILDDGAVGILEAGTGTGKSLAYLVPASLWARRGDRRVVVATRTINLQEQILSQDLPLLEEALGTPVKASLVKGRGNYCCLRKRDMLAGDSGGILLDFDDMKEAQMLLEWSRSTSDGSLSDLPFVPGAANWSLLRAESDSCIRARCFHFSNCFFYTARMEAASADILLANHHVLFADLALRAEGSESAAIMPRYDAVILDEGHNVEDIAISYFDAGLSRRGLLGHLGRLVSRRRSERGLVPFLRQRTTRLRGLGARAREGVGKLTESLDEEVNRVRSRLDILFEELGEALVSWLGNSNKVPDSRFQIPTEYSESNSSGDVSGETGESRREARWRIPLSRRNESQWTGIQDRIEEMVSLIGGTLVRLRQVNVRVRELVEDGLDDLDTVWADLSAVLSRLDASATFLKRVIEGEEMEEVFWVEVRVRKSRWDVSLHLTPLDVSPILRETLFSQVPSLVFTSATLTVMDRFDFFDRRLGINDLGDREVVHRIYPSPFDLSSQMRLAILDDLPDPGMAGFIGSVSKSVLDLVIAAGGGALVLFTSYRTLKSVYELCLNPLLDAGIAGMCQGEATRSALLEQFRADPDSVLFATDSFWEGVDVVGSSLRLVILARLPFPVPTDPVNEARGEVLLKQGRDPFLEDSVPRAVIRMRQGLGRLIRHREDRGCAVICDGRIIRRAYGRIFLQSLGDIYAERTGTRDLVRGLKEFLKK